MESGEEQPVQKANALFEAGAEVVYIAVEGGRVLVDKDPPERPGVVVAARSVQEVLRFVRDLDRDLGHHS